LASARAVAVAADPPTVGALGDLDRLRIEGNKAYSSDAIRSALARDLATLKTTTPSAPLADFLATLARKVTLGYQVKGFLYVHTTAAVDAAGDGVTLHIQEGERYQAAEVRIVGAKAINARALVAALTVAPTPGTAPIHILPDGTFEMATWEQPEWAKTIPGSNWSEATPAADENGPAPAVTFHHTTTQTPPVVDDARGLWQPGKPADVSPVNLPLLEDAVRVALAAQGRFWADFKVEPRITGHSVALVVTIQDEGPAGVLSFLVFTGLKQTTPKQMRDFLGIKEGTPAHLDLLRSMHTRLWDSGRFLKHELRMRPMLDAGQVALTVDLIENPSVPTIDRALAPADVILLKLPQWISAAAARGDDLAVRASGASCRFRFALGFHQGMSVSLSPPGAKPADGHATPATQTSNSPILTDDFAFVFATDQIGLYSRSAAAKFVAHPTDTQLRLCISVLPGADPAKDSPPLSMNLGVETRDQPSDPPVLLSVTLSPAAVLALAHREDVKVAIKDQVLTLAGDESTLRLDARTGALIEWKWIGYGESEGGTASVTMHRGAFAEHTALIASGCADIPNRYDPAHPVGSFLGCAIELASRAAAAIYGTDPAHTRACGAALRHLLAPELFEPLDAILAEAATPATQPADAVFFVPLAPADVAAFKQAGPVAIVAQILVPWADRFLVHGSWPWALVRQTLQTAGGDPAQLSAEAQRIFQSPATGPVGYWAWSEVLRLLGAGGSQTFAGEGLKHLEAADFQRDCRVLLDPQRPIGKLLGPWLVHLGRLTPEDMALLESVFAPADRIRFGRLVEAARLLGSAPTAPDRNFAGQATLWDSGLREVLEVRLKELAAP
jgi:hypothetical protein